jgi:NAD(P)-dependent dehydrogenase (short-subunit alcohol dehydrogenase family)
MDGQTAVVTGASRGIGAAVAGRFAEAGAHVLICARDVDPLEAVASDIREHGGSVTAMRADVRDEFDVERLLERAAREGDSKGIDIVLANAGVYHGTPGETPLPGESYAAFDDHLRTNARGVFATIREAVPHLTPEARVLVTSGRVAREQTAGYGSYAVSKATAEAVAAQFAVSLDPPVGVVDPGQVETDLTGGRGLDPADVTEQFYWAAADADPDTLDGAVRDRQDWREATR